ncbi:hypothetical protein FKM82_004368 [Ascaphus truei]
MPPSLARLSCRMFSVLSLALTQLCPFIQYTPELIAGPGAEQDPSEVTVLGCECQGPHCVPTAVCACLPHGANYISRCVINTQGPIFECNIMCSCGESCPNRETQRGLQFRLQVCKTDGKGWGLSTQEHIPSGRFVCEYAGEVLSREEACNRIHLQEPSASNYIISVREHLHGGQILQSFVDPTHKGNVGRFLNHSCQPNLFMLPVRMHSMVPKLALFTARDILPGEELCYDYSGNFFNPCPDTATPPRDMGSGRRCRCGAPFCSGFLPYDSSLNQAGTQ